MLRSPGQVMLGHYVIPTCDFAVSVMIRPVIHWPHKYLVVMCFYDGESDVTVPKRVYRRQSWQWLCLHLALTWREVWQHAKRESS
ncbi:MAG: hypothetical protein HUU55_15705 [Myxococcales bacterium]|nr:hypothetical protein [Myxococcales bacterium]